MTTTLPRSSSLSLHPSHQLRAFLPTASLPPHRPRPCSAMSADELRQRIAQLEAELAAERQHSTFVGPAIQIPSSSKTSLSEQVLQCKPVLVTEAEAEEEEAAAARTSTAAGPPRAKKGEGDWIPTNLRLLQAAMTQRAVTAAHYAATKAAASAAASEKVLTTLVEKKVYSAHIKVGVFCAHVMYVRSECR